MECAGRISSWEPSFLFSYPDKWTEKVYKYVDSLLAWNSDKVREAK